MVVESRGEKRREKIEVADGLGSRERSSFFLLVTTLSHSLIIKLASSTKRLLIQSAHLSIPTETQKERKIELKREREREMQ